MIGHRLLCVAALACAIFGRAVGAQSPTDSSRAGVHQGCRDPHPLPVCRSYLLFEIVGTTALRGTSTGAGCLFCATQDLPGYLAWDVGWMINRDPAHSLGGSLQIGGSEQGVRIAVRARRRTWLPHRVVLDAAIGPLMAQRQGTGGAGVSERYGVTEDFGVGVGRIGLVTLGVDVTRQPGHVAHAFHAGVRLESSGMAAATAIVCIGAIGVTQSLKGVF